MATKRDPGKFDCYANAADDEPMFILLGRDPFASFLVDLWVKVRTEVGCDAASPEKLLEAQACSAALERWAHKLGKSEKVDGAREAYVRVISRLVRDAVDD